MVQNVDIAKAPYVKLTLMEMSVLVYHLFHSAENKVIGFEHPEVTYKEFIAKMAQFHRFNRGIVEDLIFSTTLCSEYGKYKHPLKVSYEDFLRGIIDKNPELTFHKQTGTFERGSKR